MGSLSSRPKIPAVQQPQIITYVATPAIASTSQPAAVSASSDSSNSGEGGDSNSAVRSEAAQAEARSMGLLERSRGRLSTVLTGFRGVLTKGASETGQRKTLLGE